MIHSPKVRDSMNKLLDTSASLVLAEFLRELLQDRTKALLHCNKDNFERQQGRAQEVEALLQIVEKKGV